MRPTIEGATAEAIAEVLSPTFTWQKVDLFNHESFSTSWEVYNPLHSITSKGTIRYTLQLPSLPVA